MKFSKNEILKNEILKNEIFKRKTDHKHERRGHGLFFSCLYIHR